MPIQGPDGVVPCLFCERGVYVLASVWNTPGITPVALCLDCDAGSTWPMIAGFVHLKWKLLQLMNSTTQPPEAE